MFVERTEANDRVEGWFEARARRHPGLATGAIVLLAVGVTVGLLLKTDYSIVLYQGF